MAQKATGYRRVLIKSFIKKDDINMIGKLIGSIIGSFSIMFLLWHFDFFASFYHYIEYSTIVSSYAFLASLFIKNKIGEK